MELLKMTYKTTKERDKDIREVVERIERKKEVKKKDEK